MLFFQHKAAVVKIKDEIATLTFKLRNQYSRNANGRLTVRQIARIAKAHKHKHGLSCLIIDQLDKIIGEGKHSNPFERVAAITADLKHLANEMDVAIKFRQ